MGLLTALGSLLLPLELGKFGLSDLLVFLRFFLRLFLGFGFFLWFSSRWQRLRLPVGFFLLGLFVGFGVPAVLDVLLTRLSGGFPVLINALIGSLLRGLGLRSSLGLGLFPLEAGLFFGLLGERLGL